MSSRKAVSGTGAPTRTISKVAAVLVIVLIGLTFRTLAAEKKSDILWDKYGVPHIFATDRESMFYAHGWAQMQNQANLLLRLYGESRGRAGEYWGPSNLELDRWVQLNGVPERAKEWYASPEYQEIVGLRLRAAPSNTVLVEGV